MRIFFYGRSMFREKIIYLSSVENSSIDRQSLLFSVFLRREEKSIWSIERQTQQIQRKCRSSDVSDPKDRKHPRLSSIMQIRTVDLRWTLCSADRTKRFLWRNEQTVMNVCVFGAMRNEMTKKKEKKKQRQEEKTQMIIDNLFHWQLYRSSSLAECHWYLILACVNSGLRRRRTSKTKNKSAKTNRDSDMRMYSNWMKNEEERNTHTHRKRKSNEEREKQRRLSTCPSHSYQWQITEMREKQTLIESVHSGTELFFSFINW